MNDHPSEDQQLLLRQRAPEIVRTLLLLFALVVAVAAALAPVVYILRRLGVG